MVRHTNKEKRVAFFKMLVENNDQFNDMNFSDECTVHLHQNTVYIYRRFDQVRPSLPKPKHPLKVHVWAGIRKKGATLILIFDGTKYYKWTVLYRPHHEGHIPVRQATPGLLAVASDDDTDKENTIPADMNIPVDRRIILKDRAHSAGNFASILLKELMPQLFGQEISEICIIGTGRDKCKKGSVPTG
ncbi:Hypothetical predicted protein [Mytilus galloprovincialis]|uniref:Uncharacterized protein n=1 Tax=Mytilus galloprovincialis TaxID=29158 RepID=A0A8B6BEK3_MYTGA|nr:Hypothetical predicted protein [Mytilus galloprovincialis]